MDPLNWPDPEEKDGLHEFGNLEFGFICDHFRLMSNINKEQAIAQWIELKNIVVEMHGWKNKHPLSIYQTLRCTQRPDIDVKAALKIIELPQLFPLATAVVERGFSHLKVVKTDYRARLQPATLDDLMRIKLAEASFHPTRPVQRWWVSGQRSRRPDVDDHL